MPLTDDDIDELRDAISRLWVERRKPTADELSQMEAMIAEVRRLHYRAKEARRLLQRAETKAADAAEDWHIAAAHYEMHIPQAVDSLDIGLGEETEHHGD